MEASIGAELAEYREQFHANRREAAELCTGLSKSQFNWRPQPGRWSIAECLGHLNVSAEVFGNAITIAAERGRQRGQLDPGPFNYGPLSRWLLRKLAPPVVTRYKTPHLFDPPSADPHSIPDVLARFEAAGKLWDSGLSQVQGLDLARIKVPSPAVPLLRFRLGALFAIQAVHERRHLWQAWQVKAALGFPSH